VPLPPFVTIENLPHRLPQADRSIGTDRGELLFEG
jgi:hypothetical protein